MKKHINLWLVMFLAMSLALPIYSMAQTSLTLTLQSSTGDRISTPGIKSFAIDANSNMTIYLSQPFNFTDLVPDISVVGTAGTYSNCTVSTPASVTATQPAAGTSLPISFQVASATSGATLSLVVDPEGRSLPASGPSPFTFPSWDIGGATPAPVGSYLAVFQASAGGHTSQLVVMINITPPETVSQPTISGPSTGTVNQSYTFTASATSNPSGDTLQYFFNWGDGSSSTWNSSTSAQHTWTSTGTYSVTVQARSATYTSVVSQSSTPLSITISNVPTYSVSVSVSNSAGGSVTSATTVSGITSGGQATFNVTTNSGYTASVSAGTLSATTGTATWTFTNVTSTITATITFTQQTTNNNCSSAYSSGTQRASATVSGTQCWSFIIPANTLALLVAAVGTTNDTYANLTWTFPDGRVFPTNPSDGSIIGTGTTSPTLRFRSQNAPGPNIPDAYIPAGTHIMTITGNFTGFFEATY